MRKHIGCLLLLFLAGTVAAQQSVGVAVINDGLPDRLEELHKLYVDELLALTEGEFDISISRLIGDWNPASINAALDQAYADPSVDMVVVTGFVANQLAATRRSFPKPTFCPRFHWVSLGSRSVCWWRTPHLDSSRFSVLSHSQAS